MPQFSQWTRPQRRGLLFLALVFVVGHLLLFFVNQEQHDITLLRPLPDDLITKRDSLRQQSFKKDTIYPFNPNRLSVWHAYRLDLPKSLVDTIQSRVAQESYFQTAQEFKEFAGIGDPKMARNQATPSISQMAKRIKKKERKGTKNNSMLPQRKTCKQCMESDLYWPLGYCLLDKNSMAFWSEISCKIFGGLTGQP